MKRHLFVLHVWPETLDEQLVEWRGRITYLGSGEVRFFRDSATLYRALLLMLPDLPGDGGYGEGKPGRTDDLESG